jgi:hypothetical protein
MAKEAGDYGQSNFFGRDGMRLWLGQIAPRDAQEDQTVDGDGWGNRYKVRIMGHHPFDETIENKDLPFAQVMLPSTAGSGAANFVESTELQQGDVCIGFFMDGDKAQQPCILGHFAHTADGQTLEEFSEPFKKFTGYTEDVPVNPKIKTDQSNEQNSKSNETNTSADKGEYADQDGAGKFVLTDDPCNDFSISRMTNLIENMANKIEELSLKGAQLEAEIGAVADVIETQANGFVGRMMDVAYDWIEPQLSQGLDNLYKDTFSSVFGQMGNTPQSYATAHAAGRANQTTMVNAVKNAENGLACAAAKIVEGIKGTVKDALKKLLAGGLGAIACIAANFVGSFIGDLMNRIQNALAPIFDFLKPILQGGLQVADFLRSAAGTFEDIAGFLDCGQSNKGKCAPEKKYQIAGPVFEKGADPFNYIHNLVQKSPTGGAVSDLLDALQGAGGCTGGCEDSNPFVEIFGGGGVGAIGEAVLGNVVENSGLGAVADSVTRTAGIIGVDMKVPGSGYTSAPTVRIGDKCSKGYGATAKAIINEEGQVEAIVVNTEGEGYPVVNDPPTNVGMTGVYVQNPGRNYGPNDFIDETRFVYETTAEDAVRYIAADPNNPDSTAQSEQERATTERPPIFNITVDPVTGGITNVEVINILRFAVPPEFKIVTASGTGAILKPIFGTIPPVTTQKGLFTVIDCVS